MFVRTVGVCAMQLVSMSKQIPNIAEVAVLFVRRGSSVWVVCVWFLAKQERAVAERFVWTSRKIGDIAVRAIQPVEAIKSALTDFADVTAKKTVVGCASIRRPIRAIAGTVGRFALLPPRCVKGESACRIVPKVRSFVVGCVLISSRMRRTVVLVVRVAHQEGVAKRAYAFVTVG